MKYNSEIHHRRTVRLQNYDYSSTGAYFLTVCTQNREHVFGEIEQGAMICNHAAAVVHRTWIDLVHHYENVMLDVFVVMPNHFHGIVFIKRNDAVVGAIHELPLHELPTTQTRRQMLIPKIIGRFKMVSAKQINQQRKTQGNPVWQRNYWEHIIRNEDELNRIRNYIENNPVQWENDTLNGGSGNRVLEPGADYGWECWMV